MDVLINIIKVIISGATPALIDIARSWVRDFRKSAAETPNPWDDVLAGFLAIILGVND